MKNNYHIHHLDGSGEWLGGVAGEGEKFSLTPELPC